MDKMPALPRDSRGSYGRGSAPRPASGYGLRLGAAAVALLFLMADAGIGRDEFLCEVAVGHLADCCQDFPAQLLHCEHNGCDGNAIPDLDEDRAQCLRDKSCDELQALGACDMSLWDPVASCVMPCSPKIPPCH